MEETKGRESEKRYACWLCNFPGMSNRQMHRLTELCGSAEAAYFADRETWGKVLTPKQTESLKAYTAVWKPEKEYMKMREEGIDLVTCREPHYPGRLREIPDAPFGLFYRGRLPGEQVPAVAVIGARECSEYGKYVAKRLGTALGRSGIVVVSGMAKGIDGISQNAVLEAGGYSVGVLGSGVDICYPARNRELYEKLAVSGAVISSYPLGTGALGRNFPPRNRIVSGLADAIVVIEARAKSGTLITVDMALEQGREVYAVPGRVTDRLSDGCNRLIRQGAGVVLELSDFLEEIRELGQRKISPGFRERGRRIPGDGNGNMGKIPGRGKAAPKEELGTTEKPELSGELAELYGALDFMPRSPGEIQAELAGGQGVKPVIAGLMQLVAEGLAVQTSPGYFCLKGD